MIQAIHFRVKKWQHNPSAKLVNTKTENTLIINPLRKKGEVKAQGIAVLWLLVITANDIEVAYYSSEDCYLVPDRPFTETQLLGVLRESYNKNSIEVANRHLAVGLDAGFSPFENIQMDLKELVKVVDM